MGLNIVVNRRLPLQDFAEGWDNCYLLVRGVNEARRQELLAKLDSASDQEAADLMQNLCLEVIVGGQVITTDEDGSTRPVTLNLTDVPEVVEALNLAWRQEVVSIATGTDRLKATLR
ncbi:hypothetical protein [Arthrobacter sp. KNU40]|uniref:hypothetical protein n=1 Tax=Arthrobacter sp. KNU40 TaxID=3447965 RepID=UPI003F646AA1